MVLLAGTCNVWPVVYRQVPQIIAHIIRKLASFTSDYGLDRFDSTGSAPDVESLFSSGSGTCKVNCAMNKLPRLSLLGRDYYLGWGHINPR